MTVLFPYADQRGLVRVWTRSRQTWRASAPAPRGTWPWAPRYVPALDPQPATGPPTPARQLGPSRPWCAHRGCGTARERGSPVPPLAAIRPKGSRTRRWLPDGTTLYAAIFDARSPALERAGGGHREVRPFFRHHSRTRAAPRRHTDPRLRDYMRVLTRRDRETHEPLPHRLACDLGPDSQIYADEWR